MIAMFPKPIRVLVRGVEVWAIGLSMVTGPGTSIVTIGADGKLEFVPKSDVIFDAIARPWG